MLQGSACPKITQLLLRKILVAQRRVVEQQSRIEYVEKSIQGVTAELDEFHSDSTAYAFRIYGGLHGVQSYPVTTRINNLREKLHRYIERRPVRAAALHDANCALVAIENEALQAGHAPVSPNSVSWPPNLPKFIGYEFATKIDSSILARAQEISDADNKVIELKLACVKSEHAQTHDGIGEALAKRRDSFPPPLSSQRTQIVLANGLAFTIISTSMDGQSILQNAILNDQSESIVGHTWNLARAIFHSGVDWPGWEAYHKRFCEACKVAMETCESENAKAMSRFDGTEYIRQVALRHYCPEGVLFPQFVGGSPVKPSQLKAYVQKLGFSKEQAEDWFLTTRFSRRIGTGHPQNYGLETLAAMEHVGLLSRGSSITTLDAIELLNYRELKATLADLDLKPENSILLCRKTITGLLPDQHEKVRQAVDKHGQKDGWVMQPPMNLSWMEFQSWRQQIRGMAEAITDLYLNKQILAQDRADFLG